MTAKTIRFYEAAGVLPPPARGPNGYRLYTGRHVHRLLTEKSRELDRKLKDLMEVQRRVRQSLVAWNRVPRKKAAVCPHIEARATATSARGRRPTSLKGTAGGNACVAPGVAQVARGIRAKEDGWSGSNFA